MAKYMLIIRTIDDVPSASETVDLDQLLDEVGRFNDALIRAGVLLAAEGLDPDPAESVVVDFTGDAPVVVDGLYGRSGSRFSGFYVLAVADRQEAVEWAKRMPRTKGAMIEIRRVTTLDEVAQVAGDNRWIAEERAWRESTGQL
ncbi:hypothetical protein CLV56_3843 [Mumia flava]|uniref:YCII-related domain-containing protein n=1 Tax=Mumia flava TaxID=1348852 RepID=A0A0B2B5J0_9ACTN|nr:YciI family protein [Mumia flava]PJJ54334.1 hypothetical protein CLV56_3843 [Mumia flava]